MMRHLLAGLGLLAVAGLAAILYAQELRNRPKLLPESEAAAAQASPEAPRMRQNYGGGGGRTTERIQSHLQLSPEDWMLIAEPIDRILLAQRALRGGMGWGAPPTDDGAIGRCFQAIEALQQAVDRPDGSREDVEAKLAALRDARKAVLDDIAATRESLRGIVDEREAAVLVMYGVLE